MICMYWFCLFVCILPTVVPFRDAQDVLQACKKLISESEEVGELDCRNHDFEHIPTNIFYMNKRIYLSENPYICDCGIVWFIRGLQVQRKLYSDKIVDVDLMTCGAAIKNMEGRRISDLKKDDVCPKGKPCTGLRCSKHAQCVQNSSTDSGKQCVCKAGLEGNGTFCKDVDECSAGSHNCDIYQDCRNSFGSFECQCKSGFKINSNGECDVAEPCEIIYTPCDLSSEVCVNKKRGYECSCKQGYHEDLKTNSCTDVNECERRNSCSNNALCFNTVGSYHCVCKQGYSGNGNVCEDIDECSTGDHHCPSVSTVCFNLMGAYKCHCKSGYRQAKNGTLCAKKEEKFLRNEFVIAGACGTVLLIFTVCCCCCCCCRRKSKKSTKGSKEKLIDTTNEDLLNLAMETDPFLLQQQAEQQMYMFGMQQQQYMPYFDGEKTAGPAKGVQPNESSITTWSDDEDAYAEYYAGYEDTYN